MKPLDVLREYWGHEAFRPMQEQVISEALAGRDVLAMLPTGGGKSVCFQVPGLMRDGISLVITPLIALMKDQVQNLEARGIRALAVHAGMNRRFQVPVPVAGAPIYCAVPELHPPDAGGLHRRGRGALHLAVGL